MTGLAGGFTGIENLSGGGQADSFTLNGGVISGTLDGAGGDDTLTADNAFNVFNITSPEGGELTGTGGFINIENLVGNAQTDNFVLDGGTISGTIDGQGGFDSLFADNLPGTFVVNGPNSGSATGTAGFAGIEQLWGGTDVDEFTVTDAGSLDGFLFGADGDDRFLITPGAGLTFNVFGGFGSDQLTVNAQAGVPTDDSISIIAIAPGGTTINYFGIESIALVCDTCPVPAVPVAAMAIAAPTHVRHRLAMRAARQQVHQADAGAFATTPGLKMGFVEMFQRQANAERRLARRRQLLAVDNQFLPERNLYDYLDGRTEFVLDSAVEAGPNRASDAVFAEADLANDLLGGADPS